MSKKRLTDEQRANLIKRYLTPNPDGTWNGAPSIARSFGISDSAVQYHLRSAGVPMRTSSQAYVNGKRTKPITHVPKSRAPACKCGCGAMTTWNRRKNRWNVYREGHYRRALAYKDRDWIHHEYVALGRSSGDIAKQFGVGPTTILRRLRLLDIPMRTQAESLVRNGRMAGSGNPAWKGGIALWPYAADWKRIARAIRKRDRYACRICGAAFPKSSKLLHVHHVDGDKFNNAPANLMTVCATCHPKGKRKEKYSPARHR